jgi:integrase
MIDLPPARTKNKKRHLVPLSEPALPLIGEMPADAPKYVFGCSVGWARCKAALDKRIAERRGKPLEPWRLHDLRHTFVTTVNELGFAEPHVTEAIVNHISGRKAGIAGRYDHALYLKQRRETLDKWGAYLTGLVDAPLTPHQHNNAEKPEEFGDQLISGTRG